MYFDTVLIVIGYIFILIVIFLFVYLIFTRKQSDYYNQLVVQETELLKSTTMGTKRAKELDVNSLETGNSGEEKRNPQNEKHTKLLMNFHEEVNALTDECKKKNVYSVDFSILEHKYEIESEIIGGGMSKVFVATNRKLGNKWIVKYISKTQGELANEENILKVLNHINLPKIIDIYDDSSGVFLIESFIEGITLETYIEEGNLLNQVIIASWAEQLSQVLQYLHQIQPNPIFHLDLKPSNIMVTHDNKLVLIDFGISKRHGSGDSDVLAVTYNYAAPEQLNHKIPDLYVEQVKNRLGDLPYERINWTLDARTDVYSLGVILYELATGAPPTLDRLKDLNKVVSRELNDLILKCLEVDPKNRYQSASDILQDLQDVKNLKSKITKTLVFRKFALVSFFISLIVSSSSLVFGYQIRNNEMMSVLKTDPNLITISLQQASKLNIIKQLPNGKIDDVEIDRFSWSYRQNGIVQVLNDEIYGINVGSTELIGTYRNKSVTIKCNVVEPLNGIVDIALKYEKNHLVEVFAGSGEREALDGNLSNADFISPQSITAASDGTMYVADSGLLRMIKDGIVSSLDFQPDYLTPNIIRTYKNDLYILTNPWEDADGTWYGIVMLNENGAEGIYIKDAKYSAIEDFCFDENGLMYMIERNAGADALYLTTLNLNQSNEMTTLVELLEGTKSLAIDPLGNVFLANPEIGVIQKFSGDELTYFAGVENDKKFIDGKASFFYHPQVIKYFEECLYVWDFNVLRKISIVNGNASETITLAGEASPNFSLEVNQNVIEADRIILPNSNYQDFVIFSDKILISDSKRGFIWSYK